MQLDADGDGKVSKSEAPEQMRSRFDMLDGNGDGFIDRAEVDALMRRFQGGAGGQGAGGQGAGGQGAGGQGARGQRGPAAGFGSN